ncbi:hypothetical protein DDE82_006232 [Stemphylium lycopersici]|nr:hypothetical protein DDE82_006232 [Stemphylium lycopersici]
MVHKIFTISILLGISHATPAMIPHNIEKAGNVVAEAKNEKRGFSVSGLGKRYEDIIIDKVDRETAALTEGMAKKRYEDIIIDKEDRETAALTEGMT